MRLIAQTMEKPRRIFGAARCVSFALFLSFNNLVGVSLAAAQATVQTDKADYSPGETVIVTGSGWLPGETVSLTFDEYPVQHEAHVLFAEADSLGSFRNEEYVIEDHDLGTTFTLSGVGETSGLTAQTTFTDSPKVGSVAVGAQSGALCSGTEGSVTYTVTVNRGTGMGSSGNFTADLTTSLLPPGVAAGFIPNPIQVASQETSGTVTLTLTTSAATSAGTFAFRVKAATSDKDTASTTAILTVNAGPTITCPSAITLDNTPGLCARNNVTFTATATGSPAPTITYSHTSGSSFPVGTTTVTATATNTCGSAICTFDVTIRDAQNPTITAPAAVNTTTGAGATMCGRLVSDATLGSAIVNDNCPGVTVSRAGVPAGNVFPKGTTTITYTATDAAGNTATATQTVTVADNTPPVITAPAPVTVGTGPLATSCEKLVSNADLGTATATDNCSPVTITRNGVPSGNIFPVGTTTITYTATDGDGNSSTATQTVTVTDTTPPVITFIPAPVSATTGPGATDCGKFVSNATLGIAPANDNCPGVTVSRAGVPAGNVFPKGTTTITYTATDAAGNTATATQTVTVADNTPPVITAPAPVTVGTGPLATSCEKLVSNADLGTATATDNCSPVTITRNGVPSGNIFPVGTTTITYTATDGDGNSSTATQTVTVTDTTSPLITTPAAVSATTGPLAMACGALVTDVALGSAIASDNCPGVTVTRNGVPSGNIFPVGETTISYTATDAAGNAATATQTVTVADNTPPVITTANLSVYTDHGLCSAQVAHNTTATDNCPGVILVGTRSGGLALEDPYPKGTTTISWVATDAHGNISNATQTITVTDHEAPVITAPAAISTFTGPGSTLCGNLIDDATLGAAVATDNCSVEVTRAGFPAGNLFPVGSTTITYTATDPSGNSATATQIVTVADNTPPLLTAPATVNATTGANATICGKVVNDDALGSPVASDNCSATVTRIGVPAGNLFPVGSTTITYTATDPSGNATTKTQLVVVTDDTPPVITAANISVPTDAGVCTAAIASLGATASDNCSVGSPVGTRSDSQPLTGPYPKGETTITWVATDVNGNTSTSAQTVTVTNPTPVAAITAPASGFIIGVGLPVTFAGSFTDNTGDVHTVQWSCDATNFAGTLNEAARTTAGSFTFSAAGVYVIKMTLKDQCNETSVATQVAGIDAIVVVYDPVAGFVTGGGWINSPAGAYSLDPLLTGKANFGFVSKYKKGAVEKGAPPEGETEFQFKAGNLNFHSTSYLWLVIAGAKAQFKGSGTINNAGDYGFLLSAVDGQISGGGGKDKFRMKITDKITGGVIYDSQMGAADSSAASTVIEGGSVVIHTSSGFLSASAPSSESGVPVRNAPFQNAPNPFNPHTTLSFTLAEAGRISLRVYNVRGELVKTLKNEWLPPGGYSTDWNGTDDGGRAVSSGAYFALISNDRGYRDRIRMILLK